LLKIGEKDASVSGINEYANHIEECTGIDHIETLQNHQNVEIYEKAVHILETFFSAEEDDQNVAPNMKNGDAYSFGIIIPILSISKKKNICIAKCIYF